MSYTVKQLSDLAGVTPRTLHYYDEIGLLEPESYGENGYRYYGEEAGLRLQQILFFKELDFSLDEIKEIIDQPEFDVLTALESHRVALQQRLKRIKNLIHTVDKTILHLRGELEMDEKDLYEGFSEEKQQAYEQEARQRWGNQSVDESTKRWNSYSPEQKKAIQASQAAILAELRDHIAEGYDSPAVQRSIQALHENMGYFYECSYERFEGLGHLYNEHPDFIAMYKTKYHPDMPEFLEKAIAYYCKDKTGKV
jgi:DNA-binding transcriptional MerR regulator